MSSYLRGTSITRELTVRNDVLKFCNVNQYKEHFFKQDCFDTTFSFYILIFKPVEMVLYSPLVRKLGYINTSAPVYK